MGINFISDDIHDRPSGNRPKHYTTDWNGNPARPQETVTWHHGTEALPYILGTAKVREMAREVADNIIADARNLHGPVVWITSNAYMPPMRDIPQAEYVYQAENNRDGELWEFLVEEVERRLSAANVALECPDYDNALYVVDMNRWQYREDADDAEDLNDMFEPVGESDEG